MGQRIKMRRDTAANWTAANPTLTAGEFGWESDTNKIKIGDGATAWSALAYFGAAAAQAFAVGAIYLSTVATNPNTLLGYGTWTAWGTGRVPVAIDTSQTEFNTVEKTGGEKTHTLTTAEIPSHAHGQSATGNGTISSTGTHNATTTGSAASRDLIATDRTWGGGSDGAHNNLQPYITCYMWKRTA